MGKRVLLYQLLIGFLLSVTSANLAICETILFDLGQGSLSTTGSAPLYVHWNNVTNYLEGVQIANAVDTTGRATTVSYNALIRWSFSNNGGVDAEGIYGRDAQKDSFFLDAGRPAASISMEGLPASESYSFTFFGSRDSAGPRKIAITIDGTTKILEAAYNVNNTITFGGVVPDAANKVLINCQLDAGSNYAYLGVVEITGTFPSVPAFDPGTNAFYVSPDGSDFNPGTKLEPFQTVDWARDALRFVKQNSGLPAGGVTVYLREGRYFRTHTLEITSADSGTSDCPILYRAFPNEQVHIIGGLELAPEWFSLVTAASAVWGRLDGAAQGNVLQVDLAAHGITDYGQLNENSGIGGDHPPMELNFKGNMMQLARWPNSGFALVASAPNGTYGQQFGYNETRPQRWTQAEDPWAFGYWYWNWYDDYVKITNIDTTAKVMSVTPGPAYGIRAGQRWYALNLLEEIDTPGEWYLDRTSGTLYFWPPADLSGGTTLVSTLGAPLVEINQAAYVTFRDIIFEVGRNGGIMISGGNNNAISKCIMRSLASYGAYLTGTDNAVEGCDIYDIEYALALNGGDRATLTPAHLSARNNHLHDFGRWNRTYSPAVSILGCGNQVAHNVIHDGPHAAITQDGNNHLIEYNEIYQVVQESSDAGAFYTGRDWSYQGNIIRYNFIHHIVNPLSSDIHAVYLDDMASGYTVLGNVFYQIAGIGLFNNGGRDNISENNVFAQCQWANYGCRRGVASIDCVPGSAFNLLEDLQYYNYQNPPWSTAYPRAAEIPNNCNSPEFQEYKNPGGCAIVRNIGWQNSAFMYEGPAGGAGAFDYYTIADNLENQDPLFVDEANLNLALRADSPAYMIPGFQRIPFEQIGLIEDADLNQDGQVNLADFAIFAAYWLSNDECSLLNDWCFGADFDGSGMVDANDLAGFVGRWSGINQVAPVNEPNYPENQGAFIEEWNYTTGMPLSRVSPWKVGYWEEKCHVETDPAVGNYVEVDQNLFPAGDAVYIRDADEGVNYRAAFTGQPLLQVQAEMLWQGDLDHMYVGLGDFSAATWSPEGKQAFNFAIWHGELWVYDGAGTLFKDTNKLARNEWYDIKVLIDPAANEGEGQLDLYYKLKSSSVWTASAPLTALNLQLLSCPVPNPYTQWTGLFIRLKSSGVQWGGAKLSRLEITGVDGN